MNTQLCNDRSYALALAKRYFYERNVTLDAFVQTFAETSDPLIARLIDLTIQEPARSGRLITVSQRDYEKHYWPLIAGVLQELERGDQGVLPEIPPWSKMRIFWVTVFLVFVAASAGENGVKFWRHMNDDASLPAWSATVYLFAALLMGLLVVKVAMNLFAAVDHRVRTRNVRNSPTSRSR